METLMWVILYVALWMILAFQRARLIIWTIAFGVLLLVQSLLGSVGGGITSWVIFAVIAIALNVTPLRKLWLTGQGLKVFRKVMPPMSVTEAEALTAGTVGWEGECFSGKPDWKKLRKIPAPQLSKEEQDFIDGPVEKLCSMLNDWQITHELNNLPENVWQFIKDNGFFGMIIPKEFGGLEFTAHGHSAVISKLAGISVSAATIVSVPNSLGPGELIMHYGTDEQKNHYLPRLAKGKDIPCFALTSPTAGSDAAAMTDSGVICKRTIDGKEQLGILMNWNKRYITLSPVATIVGVAFKCYDPDHLIGDTEELGITCALIPVNTPGVVTGRRHCPLNSAFPNGPTQGHDVFVSLDAVIGGKDMVGHGWRMLMECLAAGRGISLPSMVMGGARMGALASGVYSHARRQFNTAIANFEGVEEVLTRIAGHAYMMDSVRCLTLSYLDVGEKPAVASAIGKYHVTEMARKVVIDTMDVHGGKAICLGPNNYIGRGYQESPVSITVEGANILTRSMIIFGQGAVRCHPYMLELMQSARDEDKAQGLKRFDKALMGHLGYMLSNWTRCIMLSITDGIFVRGSGYTRRYTRMLTRYSAAFSHVADICMMTLGGDLKRKEKLSARLGDCLSNLYMGSAVIKYYEDGGSNKDELPALQWAMETIIADLQEALNGILRNMPNRFLAWYLRCWVFPYGQLDSKPNDKTGHRLAKLLTQPSVLRDRLGKGAYLTPSDNNLVGQMCHHFKDFLEVESLESKLAKAHKKGKIKGYTYEALVESALDEAVLTKFEAERLLAVNELRTHVNAVDDFDPSELANPQGKPSKVKTASNDDKQPKVVDG
ncbi:MAG: acyl-CoA dehydrogenase [Coxiellaceae bacterium]|nr:acyl-CoA dehydrogenase [Coxiellaceae bacterium]